MSKDQDNQNSTTIKQKDEEVRADTKIDMNQSCVIKNHHLTIEDFIGQDLEAGKMPIDELNSLRSLNISDTHLLDPSVVEEQHDYAISSSMTSRNNINDEMEDKNR